VATCIQNFLINWRFLAITVKYYKIAMHGPKFADPRVAAAISTYFERSMFSVRKTMFHGRNRAEVCQSFQTETGLCCFRISWWPPS